MPPKKYPISLEAQIKFNEIAQLKKLRDVYAKIPFGHRKAVKTAKETAKTIHVFWKMVEDEVLELKNCAITYNEETGTVHKTIRN